jgi:hypothetical protein
VDQSFISALGDSWQAGSVKIGQQWRAARWNGSASSFADLHPGGAVSSYAAGTYGADIVGFEYINAQDYRALFWTGKAIVSLHPQEATRSDALDVFGSQQVGSATFNGVRIAALWSGSSESFVNLHPVGVNGGSVAHCVHDGEQGGFTIYLGQRRAALWGGSANSYVDLHPEPHWGSEIYDLDEDQQVGYIWNETIKAGLWKGTAGSFVQLSTEVSEATGVDDGVQVGFVGQFGMRRAVLWRGTPGSVVDLHESLPSVFVGSEAHDVKVMGDTTRIVGAAYGQDGAYRAVMWTAQSCAPESFAIVRGVLSAGDLNSLVLSDDDRLVIRPGIVFNTSEPPIQVLVNATAPNVTLNGFSFSVESSASFANAMQSIALWNYVAGAYETADARLTKVVDDVVTVTITENPARFIDPVSRSMRSIVRFRAVGPSFVYPWSARIDRTWWTFPE